MKLNEAEPSDIGRDLKHFPHGWWYSVILIIDLILIGLALVKLGMTW